MRVIVRVVLGIIVVYPLLLEKRQVLQLLDAFIERGQLKRKAQAGAVR